MRRRILKVAGALAVVALAGVAGATYAASQDGGDKGAEPASGVMPVAINNTLVPEAKFVPIAPCRIMDTRNTSGRINPGTVRAFDAFGSNLSSQGGNSSGCGIPSYAEAIEINLTAVSMLGTGWLRGAAQNTYSLSDPGTSQTLPNATLVNYSTALNASNSVTIPLCGGNGESTGGILLLFFCSGGKEFRIGAFNKATSVVGDATGYYVAPSFIVVNADPDPPVKIRSNDMGSITRSGVGTYEVSTTRDLRGCALIGSIGNSNEENAGTPIVVAVDNVDSNSFRVRTVISDTDTLVDDDWSVVATC